MWSRFTSLILRGDTDDYLIFWIFGLMVYVFFKNPKLSCVDISVLRKNVTFSAKAAKAVGDCVASMVAAAANALDVSAGASICICSCVKVAISNLCDYAA